MSSNMTKNEEVVMEREKRCDVIKVLLVDRQPLRRTGIRATLNVQEDLILMGEVTDEYEAKQLSKKLIPDVLLLDLDVLSPKVSNFLAYFHEHCQQVKVLTLSSDDKIDVSDLLANGVMGCIFQNEEVETLVCAIRNVAKGYTWLNQNIVKKLVQEKVNQPALNGKSHLTNREQQILKLIAQGWSNTRIATELCLAQQTVRNYISKIYPKISATSRSEAIIWAREYNFTK